jgi:hypothetical protein
MVFPGISLLQQDASPLVDHEDRKGAMQEALPMHRLFRRGAHGAVALIDQDQRLVGPFRRSHLSTRI